MQSWTPPPASGADRGSSASQVSVAAAFRFAFDAPERNHNLVTGSVLLLIPLAGPIALMGFLCEVHQRLARGREPAVLRLQLSDISHYLGRGMTPSLVELVLGLPVVLFAYGAFAGALVVGASSRTPPPWLTAVGLVFIGSTALGAALVLSVLFNAARTRAELSEDFVQSLSLRPLVRYAVTTAPTVLAKNVIFLGAALALTLAGLLVCCVGAYPAAVLLQIAGVHLRWQIYDGFVKNGGTPIQVKAPVEVPSEGPDLKNMYGRF